MKSMKKLVSLALCTAMLGSTIREDGVLER